MQVPEKLALIGGSILLSSTLIFTLKSQASSIIPSVGHSISHVFDHIGDAQTNSDFNSNYQRAQKSGWKTGQWGTAPYYIDNNMNMHVGKGKLQAPLTSILNTNSIKELTFEQPVTAPQNSNNLLSGVPNVNSTLTSGSSSLTTIHGLENLDTSDTTDMTAMFANNYYLKDANLSGLNTGKVQNMQLMFTNAKSLNNNSFNINNWNVSNVKNMNAMFNEVESTNLNLSNWDTSHVGNFSYMFAFGQYKELNLSSFNINSNANTSWMFGSSEQINKITIGNSIFSPNHQHVVLHDGIWQSGNQQLDSAQLVGDSSHPGTWTKQ